MMAMNPRVCCDVFSGDIHSKTLRQGLGWQFLGHESVP